MCLPALPTAPIITHSVNTSQCHGHPLYSDKPIFAAKECVDLRISQARSGKQHHSRCGLHHLSYTRAVCRSTGSSAARHPSDLHTCFCVCLASSTPFSSSSDCFPSILCTVSFGAVFLYRCIYSVGGGFCS